MSIARVNSNTPEKSHMIEIELRTEDHIHLQTISIDPKDFTLALTGLACMPCEITPSKYQKECDNFIIGKSIEEMQAQLDEIPKRPSLAELGIDPWKMYYDTTLEGDGIEIPEFLEHLSIE